MDTSAIAIIALSLNVIVFAYGVLRDKKSEEAKSKDIIDALKAEMQLHRTEVFKHISQIDEKHAKSLQDAKVNIALIERDLEVIEKLERALNAINDSFVLLTRKQVQQEGQIERAERDIQILYTKDKEKTK